MFQVPSFRVLIVAESRHRLASLQQATVSCFKHGESGMFLFAVASEFLAQPDPFDHEWETCSGKRSGSFQPNHTYSPAETEPCAAIA